MMLAFVMTGAYASTAQAQLMDTATFTCSSVTFSFTGFPNLPDNIVSERIKVDGHTIYGGTLTFNGPSGLNTVTISLPEGRDSVSAFAHSTSNGISFKMNIHPKGRITCPDSFSIEKLQEIAGSGEGFTTSELTAHVGQTVDYEIVVKNTGNVPLTFSEFTDANCENIAGGPGAKAIAPGESSTYTCEHVLLSTGRYENGASDTGTPAKGGHFPINHLSNIVVVETDSNGK
jgi:hypothetical protein